MFPSLLITFLVILYFVTADSKASKEETQKLKIDNQPKKLQVASTAYPTDYIGFRPKSYMSQNGIICIAHPSYREITKGDAVYLSFSNSDADTSVAAPDGTYKIREHPMCVTFIDVKDGRVVKKALMD